MKRDPFFEKVWTRYMNFKCSQPAHKHMQFSFGLKAGYEAWVKAIQEDTFPSEQTFMANLNAWITSDGWHTNGGQFIPKFSEFIKKQRYLTKPFTFSAKQSVEVIPDATQEVNQKLVKRIDAAIHQRECKAIAQATKALTSNMDVSSPLYKAMTAAQKNGFFVEQKKEQHPLQSIDSTTSTDFSNHNKSSKHSTVFKHNTMKHIRDILSDFKQQQLRE